MVGMGMVIPVGHLPVLLLPRMSLARADPRTLRKHGESENYGGKSRRQLPAKEGVSQHSGL